MSMTNPAMYGILGRVVATIEPHTEADPGAILLQLAVACGAVLGDETFVTADASKHCPRLYGVVVGKSAKARKGTSLSQAKRILEAVAPWFASNRMMSGITSGEGIINQVSENSEDYRLLLVEPELGGALKKMSREGNTISAVLREGYDGSTLNVMNRRDPLRSPRSSISMIGHVTIEELSQCLQEVDIKNGLGNRILWFLAARSKLLPRGGTVPADAMKTLEMELAFRLNNPPRGEIQFSEQGEQRWCEVYTELNESDEGGVVGSLLARGDAQVLRLSLLFAVMDGSPVIDPCHIQPALAMWKYCEESVRYIFGTTTGNKLADRLLARLLTYPEGMARDDVHKVVGKNRPEGELKAVLDLLQKLGLATSRQIKTTGRPRELWFHKTYSAVGNG